MNGLRMIHLHPHRAEAEVRMRMNPTTESGEDAVDEGAMVTVGVDLAGRTGTTGVCRITWGRQPVVELLPAKHDEHLLEAMRTADKTGIDSPLGWPVAFTALLAAHQSGVELPALAQYAARVDGNPGLGNTFTHRLTDDVAWKRTGAGVRRPLSVSTDKLGSVAIRAVGLLARLAEEGSVIPRDGSGPVAEVYPAFALIQWGLAPEGTYKRKDATAARSRILAGLEVGLGLDLSDRVRGRCVDSDHDLDALISAVVARAAACGLTEVPVTDHEQAMAAVEGWIHLPRRSVGLLEVRGRVGT